MIKTEKELETRENLARSKLCSMHKVLTSKRLKMLTRLKILEGYILFIYCYGCEAWTQKRHKEVERCLMLKGS